MKRLSKRGRSQTYAERIERERELLMVAFIALALTVTTWSGAVVTTSTEHERDLLMARVIRSSTIRVHARATVES